MKRMISLVLTLTCFCSHQIFAQQNDLRKFIEVTGSAEMSVQPDEIELEITLTEYDKSGKKVDMDKVEAEFRSVLVQNKLDPSILIFNSSNNYWWHWWSYRRTAGYQSKVFNIKLKKATNFLKFVQDLNETWVQGIRIAKTSHQDLTQFRKQVKTEALRAAKEKATYLLESVGEVLGEVLSIVEIPEQQTYWRAQDNLFSNSMLSSSSDGNNEPAIDNVLAIKLRYEVKAKFAIK